MGKKEYRRVKSLNEFIEWAARLKDGQYLFRGVSNEDFEIQSSACRRLKKADGNNPRKLLKINQRLIEDARSRGHDQKNGQSLFDLELLAELQHFGAATCLMDCSRSALVALWFACQKCIEEDANGKVIAVRGDDVVQLKTVTPELIKENLDYFFEPDENGRYRIYQWKPKLQNNRIIAQHSVFLFGGVQIEVADDCVIIQGRKQEILKSLEELSDISEATMYPDFDGFARLNAHDKKYIEPDTESYLQRGIEAHQRGDRIVAIDYYSEVISLEPDNWMLTTAYYNLGVAYYENGKVDCAILNYSNAIKRYPKYADAYFNRGAAYHEKGEYERAIEDSTEVIHLKPKYAAAYLNRGVTYREKGEYERAIEDYNKAIKLDPGYPSSYNNRGRAYHYKGDYGSAIEDYNKAIKLNPDFAEAFNNRGESWLHLGEWEKARSDLTTAKDKGIDIIVAFRKDYESVPDFEQRHGVNLPEGLTAMLTPAQE